MASLSVSVKHSLPSLFQYAQTPKTHNFTIVSRLSQSQFYGIKVLHSPSFSTPSSSRTSIVAKVNKGSAPPPFTLKDQDGRNVSLSNFKGKPVVVYFYPADETPGCTKQACAFRDSYEKFKKAGAQVVGISGDDPASHKGHFGNSLGVRSAYNLSSTNSTCGTILGLCKEVQTPIYLVV